MIEKIFNNYDKFKEFINSIYDNNSFETYNIILNDNEIRKIIDLNIKFNGKLILNCDKLYFLKGNFDIDELYINRNYCIYSFHLHLNTTIKKLVYCNNDKYKKKIFLLGNYLNLKELEINNIKYLHLHKNFKYNNNFIINKKFNFSNDYKYVYKYGLKLDLLKIKELNINDYNNLNKIILSSSKEKLISHNSNIKSYEYKNLKEILITTEFLNLLGEFNNDIFIDSSINFLQLDCILKNLKGKINDCEKIIILENFNYIDNNIDLQINNKELKFLKIEKKYDIFNFDLNYFYKNLKNVNINYLYINNCSLIGDFSNVNYILINCNNDKEINLIGKFNNVIVKGNNYKIKINSLFGYIDNFIYNNLNNNLIINNLSGKFKKLEINCQDLQINNIYQHIIIDFYYHNYNNILNKNKLNIFNIINSLTLDYSDYYYSKYHSHPYLKKYYYIKNIYNNVNQIIINKNIDFINNDITINFDNLQNLKKVICYKDIYRLSFIGKYNNFELYNNKIYNLFFSNPIKIINNDLINGITIDFEKYELNINNLKTITLSEKCKNIIIKGNYEKLYEIICNGDLDYLELNGIFKQKIHINNKNINQIKINGYFNNFTTHPKKINTYMFENYNRIDKIKTKYCCFKNIIFLNNNNIDNLIINENCNLSGNFENIKEIKIKKNCKNVILKGNYSNLEKINCEVYLDYLELNGNFEKNLELNNKNINKLKLYNCKINDFKILKSSLINEQIYDNINFKYITINNNSTTLLNNKEVYKIKYIKGKINGDISNITHLLIEKDIKVNNLPNNLINLKELEINNCNIKEIPKTFIKLEKIKLNNCINISYIPNTFIKLKELEINKCNNIKELSNNFINLENLKINECNNIKEISNSFINLKNLEINKCNNIKEIPKTLINLTSLIINNNNIIKDLPNTLNNIQHLEYDYLKYYKQIIQNRINNLNNFFKLKSIFNNI